MLALLLGLASLIIAGGTLWQMLWQPRKSTNQASAPVSAPVEAPKVSAPAVTSPPPPPRPAPSAAPIQQQATPRPEPSPASKQAAPLPPSASPVPPAGQPTTQAAASIREPEMISLRGGSFAMGSNEDASEKPVRQVTVKPFAMGKFPVSVQEWNACAAAKACGFTATGKDDAPVTNVSWSDAKQYVAWLAETTRKSSRLPSEAEWEYAARGGTQTRYWWGDQFQQGWSIAGTATTFRSTINRSRSAASSRILLGCSIWAAALINGSKTAGTKPIKALRRTVQRGSRMNVLARHPLRLLEENFGYAGRRSATTMTPTCDIPPTDSASLQSL